MLRISHPDRVIYMPEGSRMMSEEMNWLVLLMVMGFLLFSFLRSAFSVGKSDGRREDAEYVGWVDREG